MPSAQDRHTGPSPRRLAGAMLAVAFVVAALGALGAGVRSTRGGHAAVDEPEYLLTALSLYEDRDLSTGDELAARRERAFHDVALPVQTRELAGGRRISPHDPLLPVLLAVPMGLGGFIAAKLTVALMAGALAALVVWTAVRRLRLPLATSGIGALLLCLSPPLSVYATQIYPEVPAALAATAGAAALLGPLRGRGLAVVIGCVVALPWLSVKYTPGAAALAVVALVRLWRGHADPRKAGVVAASLGIAGVAYAVAHRVIYGGWTAYATGDHFETTGELAVVGASPDYVSRSTRLVSLLADQDFGLLAWAPVWLLLPVALGWWLGRRGRDALLASFVAGLLTATFLALTMHGFWWPGRQLVVVLPIAGLLLLAWAAEQHRRLVVAGGLGGLGVLAYAGLLLDGYLGDLTWVGGMETATGHRVARVLLLDYRNPGVATWVAHVGWSLALLGLLWWGWRRRPPREQPLFTAEVDP